MPLAAPAANSSSGSGIGFVVVVLAVIAVFSLVIKRANKRRTAYAQQVVSAATVGSEVMTTSGMYGTVVGENDEQFLLEIAPGVQVRFARAAIARVITPEDDLQDAPPGEQDHPAGYDGPPGDENP